MASNLTVYQRVRQCGGGDFRGSLPSVLHRHGTAVLLTRIALTALTAEARVRAGRGVYNVD